MQALFLFLNSGLAGRFGCCIVRDETIVDLDLSKVEKRGLVADLGLKVEIATMSHHKLCRVLTSGSRERRVGSRFGPDELLTVVVPTRAELVTCLFRNYNRLMLVG